MKRSIILAAAQEAFDVVKNQLTHGWSLDPALGVVVSANGVVYHLVKFEEGDEPVARAPVIASIRSVAINEADELIAQGYTVKDSFAKTVTLVKWGEPGETPGDAEPA